MTLSTKTLNHNYTHKLEIDFQKNKKLFFSINLISLISFVIFYLIFYYISLLIIPSVTDNIIFYVNSFQNLPIIFDFIFLAVIFLVLYLHELIHAFFFYMFTKEKPVVGIKSIYAFAAAPEWYINKNEYLIISLSPMVLITIIGFILLAVFPFQYLSIVFFTFTVNAAGSVGDIWISILLFNKPKNSLVNDTGLVSTIYY